MLKISFAICLAVVVRREAQPIVNVYHLFIPGLDITQLAPGHGRSVANKFHCKVLYCS